MIHIPTIAAAAQPTAATAAEGAITWSAQVLNIAIEVSIVVIAVSMVLCVYRLMKGPHLADRALAVDTLAVMLIGFVILVSMRQQTLMYIDGILVLSLLGFAGTVAMAQYIARPHHTKKQSSSTGRQ